MKGFFAFLLLTSLLLLAFWTKQPQKQLIGKWKMVRVVESGQDISRALNPEGDRWIQFGEDLFFESDGTPYGRNTGTYTVDEEQMTLSLFSNAGEDDNSQWRISFRQDSLIWKGIGSPRQESTVVTYIKTTP
jgi:hypothetical protein